MKLYLAEVSSCIDPNSKRKSDVLGRFLVEPVYKKGIFGGTTAEIIGFKEVVTGIRVTKIEKEYLFWDCFENIDVDIYSSKYPMIGDLLWDINHNGLASHILNEGTIYEYLNQSKEEVVEQLNSVREEAVNVARKSNDVETLGRIRTRK